MNAMLKSGLVLLAAILMPGAIAQAPEEAPGSVSAVPPAADKVWEFDVFLDKRPIGVHRFVKIGGSNQYRMQIQADFEVKVLFFSAYRYTHANQEQWRDGCLQAINSKTDDNDALYTVSGQRMPEGFKVVANGEAHMLDGCIMSFAYWDPKFLQQSSLLNSQTGEYLPVSIEGPVKDSRVVGGESRPAMRYKLKGKELDIRLWYSPKGDWLGLESAVKGERTLRYERR